MWWLYAIAAAAFLPALGFYYVGEEAILTIVGLEMWYRGEWAHQVLFGVNQQHNPLFCWLLVLLCQLVGWEQVLPAARSISIAAVIGTGWVLGWFTRRLSGDALLGALAAVLYLMLADIALYRGWLVYTDPLYAFFIFAAVSCAWVASRERRLYWLAAAVLLITLAMLTKAFTAYVFYATAVFVLLFDRDQRRFLLSRPSIALHGAAVALAATWFEIVLEGEGQGLRMANEIVSKLELVTLRAYAIKLVAHPLEMFIKLSPAAFLLAYYAVRCRRELSWRRPPLAMVLAIALLSVLPYWLAPQSHSRYLMPVYPWFALICAYVIRQAGTAAVVVTTRWWVALLAFKLAVFLVAFPYYQKLYRGENYAVTARQVVQRTAGHALYSTNVSASGLSVAAHINTLQLPAPPLVSPPAQWDSGFVMAYTPDVALGRVAESYRLGGNVLFLLCRGAACGPVTK
jgi:4-amino-4-deoxy-L-arabinose transferase-like glycosyltransferase